MERGRHGGFCQLWIASQRENELAAQSVSTASYGTRPMQGYAQTPPPRKRSGRCLARLGGRISLAHLDLFSSPIEVLFTSIFVAWRAPKAGRSRVACRSGWIFLALMLRTVGWRCVHQGEIECSFKDIVRGDGPFQGQGRHKWRFSYILLGGAQDQIRNIPVF